MTVTAADIVNQALQLIGDDGPPVTGTSPTFDDSPAGVAASYLYAPAIQTVARQFGWDFSRHTVALTASGNAAPFPYTHEYLYPTMGVQVRQVMPGALADKNNPLPINWTVANNVVAAVPVRVIQTNQASALAVFTNQPPESSWDSLFREAVVRHLASELAMALEARPDTARDALITAGEFEKIGEGRDG